MAEVPKTAETTQDYPLTRQAIRQNQLANIAIMTGLFETSSSDVIRTRLHDQFCRINSAIVELVAQAEGYTGDLHGFSRLMEDESNLAGMRVD